MISYSKVHFVIRHSDSQTTFTIKMLISFEYLCRYSLIPIWHTYIFKNIVKEAKPRAGSPELRSIMYQNVMKHYKGL